MFTPPSRSASTALGRLRRAVIVCCWVVGVALFTQLILWSLVSFTDLRFVAGEEAEAEPAAAPLIVHADPQRAHRPRAGREHDDEATPAPAATSQPVEAASPVYSSANGVMSQIMMFTGAAGRGAMLALLAVMAIAVALAISSGTHGVEGAVSAYIWAVVVALLVLPLGDALGLPWKHGALTTYDHMTEWVDHVRRPAESVQPVAAATAPPSGSLVFYLRLGLAPVACIVGISLVGLRFCAGIEAGLVRRESHRLDPTLEREASNITPTSLHGGPRGRTSGILSGSIESEAMPSATQVSPGVMPKRLI